MGNDVKIGRGRQTLGVTEEKLDEEGGVDPSEGGGRLGRNRGHACAWIWDGSRKAGFSEPGKLAT